MIKDKYRKYPAVFALIPFSAGITIGCFIKPAIPELQPYISILIQILLALASIYVFNRLNQDFVKFTLLFFAAAGIFGFLRFELCYNKPGIENISSTVSEFKDKEIHLFGRVQEQPEINDERIRIIIAADSLSSEQNTIGLRYNIQASVYKSKYREQNPKRINYGDVIELAGKLEPLPHRRNPGEFDYGEYLKLHGIDAAFTGFGYENIKITGNSDLSFYKSHIIYPVKTYSIGIIDKLVGGEEGEFLKGLVLGERSNISKETKEEFVNAGVSHIIAVSGLNVAYVLVIIGGLLLPLPLKRSYKILLMIICLIFYMNLTGNTPSIIRATIMASVFLLSQIFERKTISYNIIAFSALIILIINPLQLLDAGFILSYSAILSIVYFYPKLNKIVSSSGLYNAFGKDNILHKSIRAVIALVIGTLAAQIGTLPVTALMFNKISVVSLFTNIAAIPLSNVALAIGLIVIITSLFSLWLAGVFASSAAFLLHWLLVFIDFSAKLDFSFIETYGVDWLVLVFYYLVIFILFTSKKENIFPRMAISLLLILNFFTVKSLMDKNDKLTLAYLDVGNSSSCIISSPKGENILINQGTSSAKYTSAERNIIPYLKNKGVKEIDLLLITSLNKDEFRNLIYLVNNIPIRKILVPVFYKPVFDDSVFSSKFSGQNIEFVRNPGIISSFSDLRIYVAYNYDILPSASMMVHIVYGSEAYTFSDAKDIDEENYYGMFKPNQTTRILKVPASGSFNFTSPEALIKFDPENVVISSVRSKKRWNSDIFSESLKMTGINVLNVGESGAVIFETDGKKTERIK